MDLLWKLLISNAAIAGGLFVIVLLIRRWIKNPALLHSRRSPYCHPAPVRAFPRSKKPP